MSIDVQRLHQTVSLTSELKAFCERLGITKHVQVMLDIIEKSFPTAHDVGLEMEEDSETGEEWLVVNATVREDVAGFLAQYGEYTKQKVAAIPSSLNDKLRLSWHFAE